MKGILTEPLVKRAIELALPTIRALIANGGTWGPKGVAIRIESTLFNGAIGYIMEELGDPATWESRYGKGLDFRAIVASKVGTAMTHGASTNFLLREAPWTLQADDALLQGAAILVVGNEKIACAASGACSQIDEAIGRIILDISQGLCHMEIRRIQEMKDLQLAVPRGDIPNRCPNIKCGSFNLSPEGLCHICGPLQSA